MKKQQTADRLLSLDIPRIVAVFLVLCRHAHWPVKNAFLDMLHCGGWVGVELFLVLSSFLVGDLLLRDQESAARSTGPASTSAADSRFTRPSGACWLMNRQPAAGSVEGVTESLAVNGHDLAHGDFVQAGHPHQQESVADAIA